MITLPLLLFPAGAQATFRCEHVLAGRAFSKSHAAHMDAHFTLLKFLAWRVNPKPTRIARHVRRAALAELGLDRDGEFILDSSFRRDQIGTVRILNGGVEHARLSTERNAIWVWENGTERSYPGESERFPPDTHVGFVVPVADGKRLFVAVKPGVNSHIAVGVDVPCDSLEKFALSQRYVQWLLTPAGQVLCRVTVLRTSGTMPYARAPE